MPTTIVLHFKGSEATGSELSLGADADALPPLDAVERAYFEAVYNALGRNKLQTAAMLKLDRRTVIRKCQKWGIK
jgi:DNA-binding NtrC family response regulator